MDPDVQSELTGLDRERAAEPGARETGEGARDTGLCDRPFGRPCDDWWVALGCFAVLSFLPLHRLV